MPFGDPRDRAADRPLSAGEDIMRSLQTGGVEGISSVLGAAGDVAGAGRWALDKAAKFAGAHGFGSGEPTASPIPTLGDLVGALGSAAAKRIGADPRAGRLAAAIMSPTALVTGPGTKGVEGAVTNDQPLYQPQSAAGKYARTIAQFAPAAGMPGGLARRAANVVVPAVASEAAGQATEGSPLEPVARLAGAVAGGVGVGLATRATPKTRLLAEASRGATDAQVAQARRLMEAAQREGIQLTMAEALQQVTNAGTGMGRLQRVVEGTRGGGQHTAPVMAERPGQVRGALTGFADTIAPPTDQPSMIGAAAQQSADRALSGVRQGINAEARTYYENMPFVTIGDQPYDPLLLNPAYTEALAQVRAHPVLGPPLEGFEDRTAGVINEVVKHLDTLAENARPSPVNPQGNNQLSAAYRAAAQQARSIVEPLVPEWSQARNIISEGRAARLEPLQRGPLGAIADTPAVRQQTSALFPSSPMEGASAETRKALQMLGGSTNDVARALVRQQLVNSANEATQDLQGGMNQWGGAKWAATQMGNPEQARTLEAGVAAVGGDVGRFDALVEALRATGKRQPPGSMTAYNAKDIEEFGKAGVLGEALRTGLNPPGVLRRLGQGFQDFQTERNAGALAQAILAEPARAEEILLLARQRVPPGEALDAIERLVLQANQSRQPQVEGR